MEEIVSKLKSLSSAFKKVLLPPVSSQAFLPGATSKQNPFLETKGIDMAHRKPEAGRHGNT